LRLDRERDALQMQQIATAMDHECDGRSKQPVRDHSFQYFQCSPGTSLPSISKAIHKGVSSHQDGAGCMLGVDEAVQTPPSSKAVIVDDSLHCT
jgi:hypothetical protein